jgi:hypothetical protein
LSPLATMGLDRWLPRRLPHGNRWTESGLQTCSPTYKNSSHPLAGGCSYKCKVTLHISPSVSASRSEAETPPSSEGGFYAFLQCLAQDVPCYELVILPYRRPCFGRPSSGRGDSVKPICAGMPAAAYLPRTREVSFAQQMTEGVTARHNAPPNAVLISATM